MRPPKADKIRQVYLEPGQYFASRRPAVVQTVLGSCIAVTMHAPRLQCGAICHALLPTGSGQAPGVHVDQVIPLILRKMIAQGAQQDELVIKLFGGSRVLNAPVAGPHNRPAVGQQNIEQALRQLQLLGLELTAHDTGGDTGRKVIFYTGSGEVFVRKQRSSPALRVTIENCRNQTPTETAGDQHE